MSCVIDITNYIILWLCSYIFTCAWISATFSSATFIASFILALFSEAILCFEVVSSS